MVFKGEKPKANEHGPYIYNESNSYSEPSVWNKQKKAPGSSAFFNAVNMNLTRELNYDEGNDKQFKERDTPYWQINQGA